MLLRKQVLGFLLPVIFLVLFACEKPSKEFSFHHDWKVESVSRAGVNVPDDAAIGDNYDFRKNGTCYLTRHATGKVETHKWRSSDNLKVLYIDDFRYEIYKAEGDELVFGQVVEGSDLLTYHTKKR